MPAAAKPADRKIRQHPAVVVELPEMRRGSVPPANPAWSERVQTAWADFWSSQLAQAVDLSDRSALERLFSMRDDQERAFACYRAQPYVDGSQGQPVSNPAFSEAMALEKAIVALEDRLGLSPKSRVSLGIAFGQARLTAAELNRMAANDSDRDVLELEGWAEA